MKITLTSTPNQNCHRFKVVCLFIQAVLFRASKDDSIMASRYNFLMQINQPAPDFSLPDLGGRVHRLSDYRGRLVIVNFWSCECPHSERADQALMAMLAQWHADVALLSIAANRNESTETIALAAQKRRLPVLLIDAERVVADLYEAQTTPHVFVIDREGILRYRGALDDVTFRQRSPTRFFLDEAVKALLDGHFPPIAETPAYGCTIVREAVE
jgi:peroxiredoxin